MQAIYAILELFASRLPSKLPSCDIINYREPSSRSPKMVKSKRNINEVDTYESDGGFVSNDDGKAPKSKKTKKAQTGSRSEGAQFWSVSPQTTLFLR